MKYLAFVFIHHWRITAILALFAIATTAGFMGAFKKKHEPWWVHAGTAVHFTNDWNAQEYPVQTNSNFFRLNQSLEAFTANIKAATAERNQRIRDFAYISALAGYAAATNGIPFERISNHVERIAVEFFTSKKETHAPHSSSSSKP